MGIKWVDYAISFETVQAQNAYFKHCEEDKIALSDDGFAFKNVRKLMESIRVIREKEKATFRQIWNENIKR